MDVVSRCPLRAASRISPSARGGFTLTVVCKATFLLMPGESPLHTEQEEPNEEDNYWDDDPGRSLYSPNDLIPFKPRADILLVGHAFAPGQAPARSILTRLVVGGVEKGIEAFCDRSFTLDGALREGPKVTRVPLRYERAAGGPGTWNPVGMRPDVTDAYGSIALPNMQRPGLLVASREDFIEPVGYGPLAPTWPTRQEKLGYLSTIWDYSKWYTATPPDRLDYSFFNVAPPDQQASEIRPNERIVLENLHPEHPRLVTSLPGIRPRAVVERLGRRDEVKLTADTLWIDTALSMCTVVWRGQFALAHRQEAGTVAISLTPAGTPAHVRGDLKAAALAAAEDPAFRTPVSLDDPDGAPTASISRSPRGSKGGSLGETQEFAVPPSARDPDRAPTGPINTRNRKPVMPFSGAASAPSPPSPPSPTSPPFPASLPFQAPSAPPAPPSPAPLPFQAPSAPPAPPSPSAASPPPEGALGDLDVPLTGETLKLTRRDVIQRAALPFMARNEAAPAPPPPVPFPDARPPAPQPIPIPEARPSAPSMPIPEARPSAPSIPLPDVRPPAPPSAFIPPAFVPPPAIQAEASVPAATPPPPILPKPSADVPPAPAMIGPLAKPALESRPDGEAPPGDAKDAAPAAPKKSELKVEEVTVEICGAIAASLARRKDEAAKILEERSITAADWKLVEKYWTDAIRKETDRGRMVLLRAYDAAYVAQLEKERGPITVEEYARLVVASERGGAAPVLEELRMPRGAFMRVERVWLDRLADDDALAASVRKAILAARMN
jgi:hypothetical protein